MLIPDSHTQITITAVMGPRLQTSGSLKFKFLRLWLEPVRTLVPIATMEAGPAAAPAAETTVAVEAATVDVKLSESSAPAKAAVEPSVTRFIQTSALGLAIAAVSAVAPGLWCVGVFFHCACFCGVGAAA